ncbi:MAG: 2,3-bisphosphoglycerate-independent phosphoglycerate mutase [Patescibacteria group bacterium]|jgi:2,3-bisphosphoglycerate-independent phosphoglycerate mutase
MILSKKKQPFVLIVLDGWGIAPAWGGNAIAQADTRNFDRAWNSYPSTILLASGDAVGLPTNSPGNSEAGHLNLGAGRIIHQDQTLIDEQIDKGNFQNSPEILGAISHAQKHNSSLHLVGLLSKTGTHSHIKHLYELLTLIHTKGFSRVYIHLFSDGRDSEPMSGMEMAMEVEKKIKEIGVGTIASLSGRFYAMDRDNRWGRIARAYNLLTKGEGQVFDSIISAFRESYGRGVTDEFVEPCLIANKEQQRSTIGDNDSIIIFNFRSDRVREITRAFLEEKLPEFSDRLKLSNLYIATFVVYDDHLLSHQVFKPEKIDNPIAKVWSDQSLRQFHIAETEKYPHATYFINGGVEKPFPGEDRLMIPSPRNFRTYDYVPKMSAEKLSAMLVHVIKSRSHDFIIANFANADMVGHTGNLQATVQAVEFVDRCLGDIFVETVKANGAVFIVGDHGNAEQMVNPVTGEADTEHTTNPVPFVVVSDIEKIKNAKLLTNGVLASVAPTILDLASIKAPESMVNPSLVIREIIKNEPIT